MTFLSYHRRNCCSYRVLNEKLACEYDLRIYRSSHPEVFFGKVVLKICSKFTGECPCRNASEIIQGLWEDYSHQRTIGKLRFYDRIRSFWSYERYLFIGERALSFWTTFVHRDLIWASNFKSLWRITLPMFRFYYSRVPISPTLKGLDKKFEIARFSR